MARKTTTLVPWFGSNRSLAHRVGEQLAGCAHVTVPFAGGMSELRRLAFHEDTLRAAQERCRVVDAGEPHPYGMEAWAEDYFVATWMTRSGKAGTDDEFAGALSVRWDAGGGDSATRFRSAVEGLRYWRKIVPRCTFVVMDCFEMLDKVAWSKDESPLHLCEGCEEEMEEEYRTCDKCGAKVDADHYGAGYLPDDYNGDPLCPDCAPEHHAA